MRVSGNAPDSNAMFIPALTRHSARSVRDELRDQATIHIAIKNEGMADKIRAVSQKPGGKLGYAAKSDADHDPAHDLSEAGTYCP